MNNRLLEIPLDLINRDPAQPRTVFDEATLADRAESIRAHGVIQPVEVEATTDGRRAAWRELLDVALRNLGMDDPAAVAARWAVERQGVEAELRALWFTFVSDYDEDGQPTHKHIPFPEGVPMDEALRQFGEYL